MNFNETQLLQILQQLPLMERHIRLIITTLMSLSLWATGLNRGMELNSAFGQHERLDRTPRWHSKNEWKEMLHHAGKISHEMMLKNQSWNMKNTAAFKLKMKKNKA